MTHPSRQTLAILRRWRKALLPSEFWRGIIREGPAAEAWHEAPARRGLIISLCLFFSVLLWFFSSIAETYTREILLETELENMPADEALRTLPPEAVTAEVEAQGMHLLQLYYDRPVIRVSADAAVVDFEESVRSSLPPNIQLQSVWPRFVPLDKEARATRKVPIDARVSIEVPPTHGLVEPPTISPDSVVISGPVSLINRFDRWRTEAFESSSLKDSLNIRLPLEDTLGGVVALGIRAVVLRARAAEFTEASRVIEVSIDGVPSGAKTIQLDPPNVTVRFRVPLTQFERAARALDFLASVTYDAIRSDTTGYIVPRIDLPMGVVMDQIEVAPARVRYYDLLDDY